MSEVFTSWVVPEVTTAVEGSPAESVTSGYGDHTPLICDMLGCTRPNAGRPVSLYFHGPGEARMVWLCAEHFATKTTDPAVVQFVNAQTIPIDVPGLTVSRPPNHRPQRERRHRCPNGLASRSRSWPSSSGSVFHSTLSTSGVRAFESSARQT